MPLATVRCIDIKGGFQFQPTAVHMLAHIRHDLPWILATAVRARQELLQFA
eukprot:CAMPEP_0171126082 /NCGR_PEP_ID=MMETSP0766_2-20121228/112595_1 /TAXON_ID=439317 /ORGANISM="Gambierdiscus australes, Strain CAWD 149" /LENGTH=50 /DNA_ID=CAMNT_0011589095 /DNA_START=117 /DNA_END=265 /DNA_ORIENTATION=+